METTLRSFRILFPPATLVGHILLAKLLNDTLLTDMACLADMGVLTAVVGLVAAATIPLGYAIGGLTTLVLWMWYGPQGKSFQLLVDLEYAKKAGNALKPAVDVTKDNALYAVIEFTNNLEPRTLAYLDRLWDAASGYGAAFVALGIGTGVVVCVEKTICPWWWVTTVVLAVVFAAMFYRNRKEIGQIVRFNIENPRPKPNPETSNAQGK